MIYNPILDLSFDEIVKRVVTNRLASMGAQGIAPTTQEYQLVVLEAQLKNAGVNISRDRVRDIWVYRDGWI